MEVYPSPHETIGYAPAVTTEVDAAFDDLMARNFEHDFTDPAMGDYMDALMRQNLTFETLQAEHVQAKLEEDPDNLRALIAPSLAVTALSYLSYDQAEFAHAQQDLFRAAEAWFAPTDDDEETYRSVRRAPSAQPRPSALLELVLPSLADSRR